MQTKQQGKGQPGVKIQQEVKIKTLAHTLTTKQEQQGENSIEERREDTLLQKKKRRGEDEKRKREKWNIVKQ